MTNEHREKFEASVRRVEGTARRRIESYLAALVQLRAHLATAPIDHRNFRSYVVALAIQDMYPGIEGVGYIEKVESRDLPRFLKDMKKEGLSGFRVWPESKGSQHFVIKYYEPMTENNRALMGFDITTEPMRLKALEMARDSGRPSATGVIPSVYQLGSGAVGFSIYAPVYRGMVTPGTITERRAKLIGLVFSRFVYPDFFKTFLRFDPETHSHLHLRVSDHLQNGNRRIIYDNDWLMNGADLPDGHYSKQMELDVAGHKWKLEIQSREKFDAEFSRVIPVGAGVSMLLLSSLLFIVLYVMLRHAEQESASKEILAQINRVSQLIAAELDLNKLVQSVTDAATTIAKAEMGAFFYKNIDENGKSQLLFVVSGLPRRVFEQFPMPRSTGLFDITFSGKGIVRSGDITLDSRFGKNEPYCGIPKGHPTVRSYLAVPVISRSGEVLGGVFLGHKKPEIFTDREETVVSGIAAHAAVAIDNARLYQGAKQAVEARDHFLSICSHELKTPLTSLKIQTQAAARKIKKGIAITSEQNLKMCESIDRQINRLGRLVDDMLDVNRIEAGRLSIERVPTDLTVLAKEVKERLVDMISLSGIRCSLKAAPSVPVIGDPDRLIQVITNLVTNAVKYGNGKPVEIATFVKDNKACLEVRDHGMGISDMDQERIFGRYERSVCYRNISGLGLGLFICKQIMDAHGGDIHVQSELGRGSRFLVELPLNSSAASLQNDPSSETGTSPKS